MKLDSSDSIFIKEKVAPRGTFLERGAIIIQLVERTRNTQVICRRCWHAMETHTCP